MQVLGIDYFAGYGGSHLPAHAWRTPGDHPCRRATQPGVGHRLAMDEGCSLGFSPAKRPLSVPGVAAGRHLPGSTLLVLSAVVATSSDCEGPARHTAPPRCQPVTPHGPPWLRWRPWRVGAVPRGQSKAEECQWCNDRVPPALPTSSEHLGLPYLYPYSNCNFPHCMYLLSSLSSSPSP